MQVVHFRIYTNKTALLLVSLSRIDSSRQSSQKKPYIAPTYINNNKQQQNKKQINKHVEYVKIKLLFDILRTDFSTAPIIDDHKNENHTQPSITQTITPFPDNTNQILSIPKNKQIDDTHDQIPDHSTSNT